MDRLTKTYIDGTYGVADTLPCDENSYDFKNLLIKTLGKYEELEEQNLLVRLPCKLGSPIFEIHTHAGWYAMDIPTSYSIEERKFNYEYINDIGKTVFLTREEAEKALNKEGNY